MNIEALQQKYRLGAEECKILEELIVDDDMQQKIQSYDQRTPEWKAARNCRLTASKFGSARGHCPYNSPKKCLEEMLWNTFKGNPFTEYGVLHEDTAVKVYTEFSRKHKGLTPDQFVVSHTGLIVCKEFPWIGVSVDAFVHDDSEPIHKKGGAEIKCPARKIFYPYVPSQYYDQIQGSMGFLKLPWWDFVVWTSNYTQIRRFDFDEVYFAQELFPRLEQFYMTQYLPREVLKRQGKIRYGYVDPIMEIEAVIGPQGSTGIQGREEDSNQATDMPKQGTGPAPASDLPQQHSWEADCNQSARTKS